MVMFILGLIDIFLCTIQPFRFLIFIIEIFNTIFSIMKTITQLFVPVLFKENLGSNQIFWP